MRHLDSSCVPSTVACIDLMTDYVNCVYQRKHKKASPEKQNFKRKQQCGRAQASFLFRLEFICYVLFWNLSLSPPQWKIFLKASSFSDWEWDRDLLWSCSSWLAFRNLFVQLVDLLYARRVLAIYLPWAQQPKFKPKKAMLLKKPLLMLYVGMDDG